MLSGTAFAGERAPARRLLSLSPGITETLYALDLGNQLVGRSDYCDYPPQVLDVPSVGTAMTPNFEAIAGLRPTLIVTESNAGSTKFELEKLGGLMALPWLTLADIVDGVHALGVRFDRRSQAANLTDRLRSRLDVTASESAPRLLLALSGQSGWVTHLVHSAQFSAWRRHARGRCSERHIAGCQRQCFVEYRGSARPGSGLHHCDARRTDVSRRGARALAARVCKITDLAGRAAAAILA